MPDERVPEPPSPSNRKDGGEGGMPGSGKGKAGDNVNIQGESISGVFGMVKGETVHVTVNQVFNTRDKYGTNDDRVPGELEKYRVGASDLSFVPDETSAEGSTVDPLPNSIKGLNTWFYALNDYEQCFVLAMTVFYGTSVGRIRDAAEELYRPLRELEKEWTKEGLKETAEPLRRIPRTEFLNRLHIISSYTAGVDRLYWRDRDANGDSEFGTRLLLYIAKEGALKFGAQEGQKFPELLRNWVDNKNDDTAYNASRALGTFWCRQNKNRLYQLVDEWAASSEGADWHRAAWSLDGVYKIERVISSDTADNVGKHVLSKLHDWVVKSRKKQENSVNLGSTAAITYAFLGRSAPDIGMNGLDSLLELPVSELDDEDEEVDITTVQEIYNAVVFCYTDLAINGGRVREVLQHLADYVRSACYERVRAGWGATSAERKWRELQRKWRVEAAFDILFWIANATFSNVEQSCCVSYQTTQPLPARPFFENDDGRDLLLEGIVSREEKEWRTAISTILCGAFVERSGHMALRLIRRWAELVMRDQSEHPDEVRQAYVRFMRDLGIQADAWCYQLQELDVSVPPVTTIFKNKLQAWQIPWSRQQNYVPLDLLAQEVLDELPF